MPRFVAPLTLDVYEDHDGKPRLTASDELLTFIADGTPLLLYGAGGIGKTTFLLDLGERCLTSGDRVPIFADAAAWTRRNTSLLQYLVDQTAAQASRVSGEDLMRLAQDGRLVLLLNGWNEMSAEAKLSCRDDLIQLTVTAPKLGVVVATRTPHDGPGLANTEKVEVRGLTWRGQSRIIRAELDTARAAELIAVLATNTPLRHATRSPLIVRGAIAKAQTDIASDAAVLDLLGAAVSTFEKDAQRQPLLAATPIEANHRIFLERLARHLTDEGITRCARADALRVITQTARHLANDGLYATAPGSAAVLDALVNHHLLHIEEDGVRFAHQRFQEYFSAEWLWRAAFQREDPGLLAQIINASAWGDVLFLICERLATQASSGVLKRRLIAAAAAIDLGVTCELVGACGFTSLDDPHLHNSLVEQVNALGTSRHSSVRTLATMYQIASRFPALAPALWELLEDSDRSARLRAHRLTEMAISLEQLDEDAWQRISKWPPERRAELLHELGNTPDNYQLLVDLSYRESEDSVRAAAIASLFWHSPASEEPVKAWLSAPPSVQMDRNVLPHVIDAVEEDHAPEGVRARLQEIALSGSSPGTLVALVRSDPKNVSPPAVDALFALMTRDDFRLDATDLLPILNAHAPERLLEAAIAGVLENKEHGAWMREVLESAPASARRRVLEEAWTRVQGADFRRIDAKVVGPLADRGQIARGIDLCLKWELVLRPVNNFAEALDLLKDRLCGGGPHEGPGVGVVVLHEVLNATDELAHALKGSSTNGLLGDQAEPALNLIEPRGVGRREMHVEAWPASQPGPHPGMLVRGVVIHDQMHLQILRHALIDVPQEGQILLMAVPSLALGEDFAVGDVQCSEQGGRAVAHVVMRDALDIAQSHRQHGLGALERLALALLIHTQHERVVGRVEIQANDLAYLLDEEGVVGELEGLRPMRLHPKERQVTLYGGLADAGCLAQRAHAPVCAGLRFARECGVQQFRKALLVMRARPARLHLVVKTGNASGTKAPPPQAHCRLGHLQTTSRLSVGDAFFSHQNDFRPPHQCRRQAARVRDRLKLHALLARQIQGSFDSFRGHRVLSPSAHDSHETSLDPKSY